MTLFLLAMTGLSADAHATSGWRERIRLRDVPVELQEIEFIEAEPIELPPPLEYIPPPPLLEIPPLEYEPIKPIEIEPWTPPPIPELIEMEMDGFIGCGIGSLPIGQDLSGVLQATGDDG